MSSTTLPVGKKRKGKSESATPSNGIAAAPTEPSNEATNGEPHGEPQGESQYVKDMTKNIRNIHKKLSASAKADSVVADNPGVPLDDLVAAKKINADQKAQILKKPALQAQLAQAEEQLAAFRAFAQEVEERAAKDKAGLVETHEAELAAAKDLATQQDSAAQDKAVEEALRTVSLFLHAAASKRQTEEADSDEGRAFEGALLLVYQGNEASLSTLKSLVCGSTQKVPDVNGELIDFTFAQVKQTSLADAEAPPASEQAESDAQPEDEPSATAVQTDATMANAGLTELDDNIAVQPTSSAGGNGAAVALDQASTGDEAANAVAEASWDPQASVTDASATNEDWVQVPRDPAETDTGLAATPAADHGTNSWADQVSAAPEEKATADNDGFEQVRRDRGRGRGRGQGRGDFRGRGRGHRGDGYRGRGRDGGAPRGARGAPRGDKS